MFMHVQLGVKPGTQVLDSRRRLCYRRIAKSQSCDVNFFQLSLGTNKQKLSYLNWLTIYVVLNINIVAGPLTRGSVSFLSYGAQMCIN